MECNIFKDILRNILNLFINIIKVILYSLPFFLSTELILGKWLLKKPKASVFPSSIYSEKVKLKFSKEWDKYKTKKIITYTRDDLGYRGWESKSDINSDLFKLILVIGDSTTDQLYEDDKYTWTEIMEDYLQEKGVNYIDVINGGIGGHTTLGFLHAIENWHNSDLDAFKTNLSTIIFNMGINEVKFFIRNKWGNFFPVKQNYSNLISFIYKNSFFYSFIDSLFKGERIIYQNGNEFRFIDDRGLRNWDFKDYFEKIPYYIKLDSTQIKNYKKHFQMLILRTIELFPNSKIVISQPFLPSCDYSSKSFIIKRMPISEKKKYSENFCRTIKEVFNIQEAVINNLNDNNSEKIFLYKMYANEEIPDKGYYDLIHPVGIGNEMIGNAFGDYLYKFIKK